MVLSDKGDNMSNSWGPGGSRWMGQGVEGDENEEGRGRSLRWPYVPTGDSPGPPATSLAPAPGAGAPMWSSTDQSFLSYSSQVCAGENGSGWASVCNCSELAEASYWRRSRCYMGSVTLGVC